MITLTTTAPDRGTADQIAAKLVDRRLAACVQVSGPVTSTYRWQGVVESAEEWLVIAKTMNDHYEAIAATVSEIHPYDTPEMIVTPITQASPSYAAWVKESLGGG